MQIVKSTKIRAVNPDLLEKAKRTQSARKFAGLTREAMETRHSIPPSTLRGWERPGTLKNQGLTLNGAQRLVKALQVEGVACSVEWLMDGKGIGPHFLETTLEQNNSKNIRKISLWNQNIVIQNEIKFFQENNPDSVVLMVTDDGLAPVYSLGDFVGGIKKYQKEMLKVIGHHCIIETASKEILIRKVCKGKKAKSYSLFCTNPQTSAYEPTLFDIKLNWAAPIIWLRKPDI